MNEKIKKSLNEITTTGLRNAKLKIKFDIEMLNNIIAFLYKDTNLKSMKVLNNINKLFNMVDERMYENDIELSSRVWIIKTITNVLLKEGFVNNDSIINFCREQIDCDEFKSKLLDRIKTLNINYDECKHLIKAIEDRLSFGYIVNMKDIYNDYMDSIDITDIKSYKQISDDLYQFSNSIINIKRQTNSLESENQFSLKEEAFEEAISDAMGRLKNRNKIFLTGIQRWNTILSPGYMSKRLYTYLALPGGGKSAILLKTALDIKKYNPNITPKNPSKTPTILFITMENNIDETIERLFNMTVQNDDIRNYTTKQVINKLKKDGGLSLTDKNNIDIVIRYYDNRSISTDDLYTIIKDLDDQGSEVVALILDYMKRIRPAEKADNEKGELKNISNELKNLAMKLDIPVITAQQLNRTAASVIDAAIQAKKEDITRLIGRDGVGSAWEIIENSDWVCIINKEIKMDTDELFLTFKLLKRRYKSSEDNERLKRLDYFNHPYEPGNDIKLIDDIDLPKPVSVISLSTQFASADDSKRGKKHAVERAEKSTKLDGTDAFSAFEYDRIVV